MATSSGYRLTNSHLLISPTENRTENYISGCFIINLKN